MQKEIDNADLTEDDIPEPYAEWRTIVPFALSFNGYDFCGSFEKCAVINSKNVKLYRAKKILPNSLTELRTCLFFEQRAWNHLGYGTNEEAMEYVHALIEQIRVKVRAKEFD